VRRAGWWLRLPIVLAAAVVVFAVCVVVLTAGAILTSLVAAYLTVRNTLAAAGPSQASGYIRNGIAAIEYELAKEAEQ
jgi:hypothetical protein